MVVAGALRMSFSKEGKPRDLVDLVKTLVQGADNKEKSASDADSEYLDEKWWDDENDKDPADGGRGDDP